MKSGKAIMWILAGLAALIVIIVLLRRLNKAPIYAQIVKQHAQFHSIAAALELFDNEFEGYPPSDATDPTGAAYCGAMKLCEAMMGRDLQGFHPDSVFRADGKDDKGRDLYERSNLLARRGPFLPPECADALTLADIYGKGKTAPSREDIFVLCDVYRRKRETGKEAGMPILYYEADTSKAAHDVNDPGNPENIYNYKDNHALVGLGVPGKPGKQHPLFANPGMFYEMTRDKKVKDKSMPCKADSYILISAGYDGLYGTEDDVTNFDR